jgi:ABC-type oligopeptide transport system substrate-binding subunit
MKKICLLFVVVLAVVLFAGCNNDPDATYTVTYNGNGATSGFSPNDNNQYKSGEEATVLGQGTLLRAGYDFLNWNTKSDGTGDSYSPGDTITIKGAVFLYAIWVVKP